MEWLLIIGVAAAWYYLANNKQVNREVTKEKIMQRFETEDGFVERETTRTYESDITDFKKQDFVNHPTPPSAHRARNVTNEYRTERVINAVPTPQPIAHQQPKLVNSPSVSIEPAQFMVTDQTPNSKRCPHCNRLQPLSEYKPNKNQPDGLTKWCTACMVPEKEKKGLKKCPKCKQMRRLDSYGESPTNPDGLHKWCKFCHRK